MRLRRLSLLAILLFCVSCRRSSSGSGTIMLQGKPIAQVKAITQLNPNRTIHLAVDTLGNVFYSLETEAGQDGVVVVNDDGIPRATQLTTANILAAAGESVGGNGTIQDIAAGADGAIYFFFSGGKGRTAHVCVGKYVHRNESISILFDTPQLQDISGMGDSIVLAHGSLVPMGSQMFFLLRHTDAWKLYSFPVDPRGGNIDAKLSPAADSIRADELKIDLTKLRYNLSPGPAGNLLLFEKNTGSIWQIDPTNGKGTLLTILSGLPEDLSRPIVLNKETLLVFAADSERLEGDINDLQRLPQTTFPALLQIKGNAISAIGRNDLRAVAGFPVYAMRVHELVPAPDGSFVGYDLASGQLLRIKLTTEQ